MGVAISVPKNKICISFLGILYFLFVSQIFHSFYALGIGIVSLSAIFCIKYRKVIPLLIVGFVMLWSNYSIVLCQLNLISADMTLYNRLNFTSHAFLGLEILYVFVLTLIVFSPDNISPDQGVFFKTTLLRKGKNTSICFVLLVMLILLINAGFVFTHFLGKLIVTKSIFEYSLILYAIAFYITESKKNRSNVVTALLILAIIIGFATRDRIVPLQMLIMLYLVRLQNKIKKEILIIALIVLLAVMVFLGNYRMKGTSFSMAYFGESFLYLAKQKLALDTSYAAYYCSLSELKFRSTISSAQILYLFKHYLIYLLIGGAYSHAGEANLAAYVYKLGYVHTYGNVSPVLCYFYLGFIGVILFALLVCAYLKMTVTHKSAYYKCLALYFVTCSFRWYLYGPVYILRGALLFSLIFFMVHLFTAKEIRIN